MERRNTIQRDMVLEAVRTLQNHASADEVYAYIQQKYPSVGKGTVYRNLKILAQEGTIRQVEVPNGPDRFDHTLPEHYHVSCVECGKVFDVHMDAIDDMFDRIQDDHGIKYLGYDILFKGICASCQRK